MVKSVIRAFFFFLLVSVSVPVGADLKPESFEALLETYNLPGLSVAVVDDYRIVYAGAFGEKEAGSGNRVDTETAFGAASISKAVTALVAAMLAEDGVIDLDAPVATYLRRWQLPDSVFTKDKPSTLRHLFTHTAGTNQSGYGAHFRGDDLPTLAETLKGEKQGAGRDPLAVMWPPETRFRYSGGGFVIAQMAIEDATGKSLAALAEEMLFRPLGMHNTSFRQFGQSGFPANAAKAHQADRTLAGPGGFPIYPQTAAAGLWSTPTDMAILMTDLQKALEGDRGTVISPWVACETTRVQTLLKAGGWGLGWMRYLADGNLDWFSHSGYGAGIGGQVMATMEGGRAITVFGNGAHGARVPAINAVVAMVIKDRGWGQEIAAATEAPSRTILDHMSGQYRNINKGFFSPFGEMVTISEQDGHLVLDNSNGARPPYRMIHVGKDRFRIDEFVGAQISLLGKDIAFFRDDALAPAKALEPMAAASKAP